MCFARYFVDLASVPVITASFSTCTRARVFLAPRPC
jgi:hypothetical protein